MIPWKICISIIANNTEEAVVKIRMAEEVADLVEVRLDAMRSFDLERIIKSCKLPIVTTFRSPKEGGFNKNAKDKERIDILNEAIKIGAHYVDIELDTSEDLREELLKEKKNTKIIVSKHLFESVPEKELEQYVEEIFASGADIAKLIGYAKDWSDNLIFLKLVQTYCRKGYKLISFAMGPYGRPSRIMSPIIGTPWTYAALTEEQKAAPGQIAASDLRQIWRKIIGEDSS